MKELINYSDKEYYLKNEYEIERTVFGGTKKRLKQCRHQIPQMIVNSWNSVLLAEKPLIKIKGQEVKDFDYDIKDINTAKLAYGKVFVVPVIIDDEVIYETYAFEDVKKYILSNEDIVYLSYIKENERVNSSGKVEKVKEEHIHYYDNKDRTYTYEIKVDDKKQDDGKIYYNVDKMAPFMILNSNLSHNGKAVFHDAKAHINKVDDYLNRLSWEYEATEPILYLPENMITISKRENSDKVDVVSNEERLLRKLPVSKDSEEKYQPTLWQIAPNIDPILSGINFELHMVSFLTGFGSKYFSYDSVEGFKTATEVVSEKSDLYKSKCLLDKDIAKIILYLINAQEILTKKELTKEEDFEVIFSDAIITDDTTKRKQYFDDYQAGVLDKYTYMELVGYTDEQIDKVRATEPNDMSEDIESIEEDE